MDAPIAGRAKPAAQQAELRRRGCARARDDRDGVAAAARHVVGGREPQGATLAKAARGEAFVLQGGDCAESFDDCRSEPIAAKLKILLQMSLVLVHATRKPVVRIGRIAGQYAKPRSTDSETRGDVTLPAYRGDIINRGAFTAEDREPIRSSCCAPTSVPR